MSETDAWYGTLGQNKILGHPPTLIYDRSGSAGGVLSTTPGPTPAQRSGRSNHTTSCFYRYCINLRVRLLLRLFIYLSTSSTYNNSLRIPHLQFIDDFVGDFRTNSFRILPSHLRIVRISGYAHKPMYCLYYCFWELRRRLFSEPP